MSYIINNELSKLTNSSSQIIFAFKNSDKNLTKELS